MADVPRISSFAPATLLLVRSNTSATQSVNEVNTMWQAMPIGRGFIMSLAIRCGGSEDSDAAGEDAPRRFRHVTRIVGAVSGEPSGGQ